MSDRDDPALNGGALEMQSVACVGEEQPKQPSADRPRRRAEGALQPRGSALDFLLLLLLFFLASSLHARPQVLVVLADHLTLSEVTSPRLPNLTRMRQEGEVALMSPGLAQRPDPVAAVYATLGAGDSVQVGDKSQGLMAAALRRAGIRAALIGDADGDDIGPYRPALLFLPSPAVQTDQGTVADPLAPGGKREDPMRLWAATLAAFQTCDLVVVHFGDFARAERENQRGFLLPQVYQQYRERALSALDAYVGLALGGHSVPLFLVVPVPPLQENGAWGQLTPFLESKAHPVAQSATTQTWGLVATRDVAPSILRALGVSPPVQMTGANISPGAKPADDKDILPDLQRMDRLTRLNQQAQNPIFWTVGIGAAVIVFGSLGLYLTGRMAGRAGKIARYGVRLVSAWPLALLLAPVTNPQTAGAYHAVIAGFVCLLALLPAPAFIFGLTAVVLVVDGLTGTWLVSNSALSEYALSGIRFYGIGNEYMGVLLGGALLVCLLAPSPLSRLRPLLAEPRQRGEWRGLTLLWFALVTFVLSFPAFGAKAGGAVTATAMFVIAWRLLRGQPVTWKHLAGSILAGFALALLWGLLSHWLHLRRTHLETATDALGKARFGYIWGVSRRKIGLALRVALHPGALLGLLGFAVLGGVARLLLREQVSGYLARNTRFAVLWAAGLWGCLVALLFNDSGIVAAILMLQCLVLSLLHGLYGERECVSSDSMSEMSESASPSATRWKSPPSLSA